MNLGLNAVELSLAEYLKENALGKENAITGRKLKVFGQGFQIRTMIHSMRLAGLPIGSCGKGYYWAKSSDELLFTLNFLGSYLRNIQEAYNAVNDSYYEMKHEEIKK